MSQFEAPADTITFRVVYSTGRVVKVFAMNAYDAHYIASQERGIASHAVWIRRIEPAVEGMSFDHVQPGSLPADCGATEAL